MSYYENPEDLKQDTERFLKSEFGKYVMSTIEEKMNGHLALADDMKNPYPERYLAKHSAVKEVIDFIRSPIG